MKKLILSLIAILSFSGCSTKYVAKCPKIEVCNKPLKLHINNRGGLDKNNTIKAIKYIKTCKKGVLMYNKFIKEQ